jgi:hypothetical protein
MKKYFFIAFALILVVSLSAFIGKAKKAHLVKKSPTTLMWFDFNGSSVDDYDNLSLYSQDPNHENPCSGSGLRCEVYAPVIESGPDAGKPDLSQIQDETFKP